MELLSSATNCSRTYCPSNTSHSPNSQNQQVITYLDKALDNSSDDLRIISNKGLVLVELEDTDQALKLVDPFLEENPDDIGLLCV